MIFFFFWFDPQVGGVSVHDKYTSLNLWTLKMLVGRKEPGDYLIPVIHLLKLLEKR